MQLAQSNHFLRERHSEGLNRWQIFLARSASAQAEQPGLPWRWGESSMMAACRPSVNLTPLLEVQSPNLNKIKPFEMWQRLDKQQQQKDTVLSPKIQKKTKKHLGCNFSHQSQDCGGLSGDGTVWQCHGAGAYVSCFMAKNTQVKPVVQNIFICGRNQHVYMWNSAALALTLQ